MFAQIDRSFKGKGQPPADFSACIKFSTTRSNSWVELYLKFNRLVSRPGWLIRGKSGLFQGADRDSRVRRRSRTATRLWIPLALADAAGSFAAFGEPIGHHGDFALLRLDDVLRELAHLRILAESDDDFRHVDRALMMRDHASDKI